MKRRGMIPSGETGYCLLSVFRNPPLFLVLFLLAKPGSIGLTNNGRKP